MIVFYIYMAQKCRFSQDQTGRFDIEPHPDEGQEDLLAVAAKVKRYVATLEGGEGGASGGGDNAGDGEEGEEEEEDEDLVRLRRQYRECMEAAVSGAPIPKAEVDKILAAPGPPELRLQYMAVPEKQCLVANEPGRRREDEELARLRQLAAAQQAKVAELQALSEATERHLGALQKRRPVAVAAAAAAVEEEELPAEGGEAAGAGRRR